MTKWLAVLLCVSLPVTAANDIYRYKRKGEPRFRVSLGAVDTTVEGESDTGYTAEVSGEFNEYVGINFEFSYYDDIAKVYGESINAKTYAANLDFGYTFNNCSNFEVKPFVSAGIIRRDIDHVPEENAFSYGAGIRVTIYDFLTLSTEIEFAEFDDYDADAVSFKIGYRY